MNEMCFQGLSTRKVDGGLFDLLGLEASRLQVRGVATELAIIFAARGNRSLGVERCLMLDSYLTKVRIDGTLGDCAVQASLGMTSEGMRSVPGTSGAPKETELQWLRFWESLPRGGTHSLSLIQLMRVSIKVRFGGAPNQGCLFDTVKNAMAHVQNKGSNQCLLQNSGGVLSNAQALHQNDLEPPIRKANNAPKSRVSLPPSPPVGTSHNASLGNQRSL